MAKTDLKDLSQEQLNRFVEGLGQSAFRGRQIFSWLYRPGPASFDRMTDLSKNFRKTLSDQTVISSLIPEKIKKSGDGTVKFAFRLDDDRIIESVLIPEEDRSTLCLSSQVGCAMGCRFCLTGKMGFKRDLSAAEIVNQVCAVVDYLAEQHPDPEQHPGKGLVSNLVFMGMGEPLANLDNLLRAIEIIMDQRGLDFSSRRITVSTCGLLPGLQELGEKTSVNLAVSLHSVRNEVRDLLMPINRRYPVEQLLAACQDYPLAKRRMIMFEYILIEGLNDSKQDAVELAEKLKKIRCKINLLPFNQSPEMPYKRPEQGRIEAFQRILWEAGYSVFIRSSRGSDISAACGQLAGELGDSKDKR